MFNNKAICKLELKGVLDSYFNKFLNIVSISFNIVSQYHSCNTFTLIYLRGRERAKERWGGEIDHSGSASQMPATDRDGLGPSLESETQSQVCHVTGRDPST